MALILSLDSSTGVCSVAIHDSGNLVATSEIHVGQSAASKLAVLIDDVRKMAGVNLTDLKAVSISAGPGSYTGLRISTSTAKGLCFGLNIPLIAVNTLDLMAHQVNRFNPDKALLCPMIDARRMEVYCKIIDGELQPRQGVEAKIIDHTSFSEVLLDNKIIFFGDGALKCKEIITHANALFVPGITPQSSTLGIIAFQKYQNNEFEDMIQFEPFYLKEFMIKKQTV
jgi:tRNA threonylcarbamoyladenosine biosynthesis protein TsaB